jgi:hypothetical protein
MTFGLAFALDGVSRILREDWDDDRMDRVGQ